MCVVSMIGDHFNEKWEPFKPYVNPYNQLPFQPSVSRQEFEALKKEVEEMKKLLIKAKKYDARNNEPNCEIEEKMDFLKKVAALVGIDLDEIINGKK